jgi:glycerol-3-phosphate dehydrogenase
MHKTIRGARAAGQVEPCLRTDGLRGVIEYYDCATDDARLVLENILDAQALGADCRNYTEIRGMERDGAGRVVAVAVRDVLTGAEERVTCRAVVVAAGAWTDEVTRRFEIPVGRELLRRTKGVHVVIPHERLPLARAITMISPVDGRVMFAIPWRERTVIGTTDTDFTGSADDVHADAADVSYLCESANGYFPHAQVRPADVIATWAGLRPLIRAEDGGAESDVSREHEIFVRDDGLIIIAGGKLTTYRRMAAQAVRTAVKWLRDHDETFDAAGHERAGTKHRPLPGGDGLEKPDLTGVAAIGRALIDQLGLDGDTATHLCGVYGARAPVLGALIAADRALATRINADLPYVWAEVEFAIRHDLARTVDDVLSRRAPLLLVGRDQGLDVCDGVADRMAAYLGWTADDRARHVAAYHRAVADSRRYRA